MKNPLEITDPREDTLDDGQLSTGQESQAHSDYSQQSHRSKQSQVSKRSQQSQKSHQSGKSQESHISSQNKPAHSPSLRQQSPKEDHNASNNSVHSAKSKDSDNGEPREFRLTNSSPDKQDSPSHVPAKPSERDPSPSSSRDSPSPFRNDSLQYNLKGREKKSPEPTEEIHPERNNSPMEAHPSTKSNSPSHSDKDQQKGESADSDSSISTTDDETESTEQTPRVEDNKASESKKE